MNILLVNSAAPELWGGGEKWFVSAAKWFNQHGHRAELVVRPNSKLLERAETLKLETLTSDFGGDFDPLAMLRARETIRTTQASVVLTNFNKESWQFGVAGRSLNVPVVARHGFTLWSKKLRHKFLAEKIIGKLIVNAESILDSYQALGLAPKDVTFIPNGVEQVKQFSGKLRRQLGITENELLIVSAGRLESQKRFDRVLNFAAELKKKHTFKLALFGTGPLETQLREQVKSLNLGEYIAFCGFDPEFASLVGDANLFLLTSDEEGTPNVVLEAMIAGVPTLGFNVGTMSTILDGELSEFLIEAGNDSAFLSKLTSLIEHRDTLHTRREKFRSRALHDFSFDSSMQRYLEVLTSAVTRA